MRWNPILPGCLAGALLLFSGGCQGPRARRAAQAEQQRQFTEKLEAIQAEIRTLSETVHQRDRGDRDFASPSSVLTPELRSEKPLVLRMEVEPVLKETGKPEGAPTQGSLAEKHLRVDVSVKTLQQALAAAGCSPGPVDGRMGARTIEAVRRFQKKNGLKADGVVGSKTWEKLKAYAK